MRDRGQAKTLLTIDECGLKIERNRVFDCHLSPFWRQMAIKSSVLTIYDLRLSIVITFSIAAYPVCVRSITVISQIVTRILFLRIGLKDIFAILKIRNHRICFTFISKRQSDCAISRGFYFLRSFLDKLGVFHANQTSMCLDPHLN